MKRRKVLVVTGSRAEYGHLFWVIKNIDEDPSLRLQLVVTGMHLSTEFGLTVREIEKDGFRIAERVKMLLSSDSEGAIAQSMGLGMIGFARAYAKLKPDIIVVLGDRLEIHAAVSAAMPFRVPVAHIHGGESTEGLIDDPIRHSITKMSHIHFASTTEYRRRIIQMGERPEHVFCFGAPGLDNITRLGLLDKEKVTEQLGIPRESRIGVVTYHPVTLERGTAGPQIRELLSALSDRSDIYWIITLTNADTSGRVIIQKIKEFVKRHPENTRLYASLGQKRYLSLLKNAAVMVGNSSSGLIEAPSFGLPVVNIGDRQRGRIRARNVIDVKICRKDLIMRAIDKAMDPGFRRSLKSVPNPYGSGRASKRIVKVLRNIGIAESLLKKEFFDITA